MALEFVAGDPESDDGGSPTIWWDAARDEYVLRGLVITDPATLAEVGADPSGEITMRFPQRMMRFFPEVRGVGGSDL